MGRELVDTFAAKLRPDDILIMPDPVYHGGTTDRSVGSDRIVEQVKERGHHAEHIAVRAAAGDRLIELARPGDRIIVMGARDDTLSLFAQELVDRLSEPA